MNAKPTILVTGGAGYIGSHCCKALADAGYQPICFDNLTTGHADFVQWGPLISGDVHDSASIASLMRSFHRAKAQFVAATEHDVAWSAHVVLARLATEGPLRAGELAELIQTDPSTVSRQVASIVKAGLVKREADPDDGRASLLVLTDEGRRVYRQQLDVRSRHMATMLRDWSEQDCRQLTFLLARLTVDFEKYRSEMYGAASPAPAAGGGS